MGSVRVASFNIRTSSAVDGRHGWWLRRVACIAAIRALDADVVGLQEVEPRQLRALRRAFSDAAVVGRGRDADGGGESSSVLVRPGWDIESSETRWLSPTPDRPGSRGWGAAHPRVVTLVRLRRGEARLGVANTHLDHESRMARERSAELLVRWLGEEPDRPWVVTGDLNTSPDSTPVRTLVDAGFADALAGQRGGTFHDFTGVAVGPRIDYVLPGTALRPVDARIVTERQRGRLASDHWPVVVDLAVPRCGDGR